MEKMAFRGGGGRRVREKSSVPLRSPMADSIGCGIEYKAVGFVEIPYTFVNKAVYIKAVQFESLTATQVIRDTQLAFDLAK